MLDITNKRMVATRKVHTCFGCTEEIGKGESAINVMAKEDEQRIRFHLHQDCNKTIVKDKRLSGSGLYYGCIKEAEKTCWTCGHWLLALGCAKDNVNNFIPTEHNHTCDKWCAEGTKGTVTDYEEMNDGTSWAENEYLKDDESNL